MVDLFRPVLLYPDTGGGCAAVPLADPATTDPAPATDPPAGDSAPPPIKEPISTPPPAPPTDPAPADSPAVPPVDPPTPDVAVLTQRAVTAELRAAAALAGVPEASMGYIVKLAQITGADATDADLTALAQAAVAQVLTDIPALKGAGRLNLGDSGAHARTGGVSQEEQARQQFATALG